MRTYNDKCRQINNNIYLIVRFLWWAKISSFLHICCCRWKHSSSLQNSQWFLCYLTVLISILGWHKTDGGQDMILLKENKTKQKLWNQECFGLPVDYFHFSAFLLLHFRIFFFNPHLSDSCYKLKFRISREAHKKNHSGVKNQKYKCYLKREHSFCVWRKTWFTLHFSCSSSSTDKPTLAERILEVPKSYIYIPDKGLCFSKCFNL